MPTTWHPEPTRSGVGQAQRHGSEEPGRPDHWFEPVPIISARTCGTRSPRAPCRRSTSSSARSTLRPGMRVLDVGCGPGRHAHELARRGIAVHGIDISQTFIDLAATAAPAAGHVRTPRRPRRSRFDGEFDAVICLCQGAFGLMTANGDDALRAARHGRERCKPGGRLALSAFNAYFAVKYHDAADVRRGHRRQPRAHRGQERGGRVDRGRSVDRLLHAARAAAAVRRQRPRCRSRSAASSRASYRTADAHDGVGGILW